MVKPKVKLTFLGTGAAFVLGLKNFHSNLLLEELASGKKLLIDCGSDARFSLDRLSYSFKDIDSVYISHIHADHTGGLEWLGFTRFFSGLDRSRLYVSKDVSSYLWENCLKAGMMTLEDRPSTLSTFFDLQEVEPSGAFVWEGITFQLIKTQHVMNNGFDMPCYGLYFEVNDSCIYFTADCRISCYEQNNQIYQMANMIFHDCETTPFKSGVHPNFQDLSELPKEIRKKMWLYHYHNTDDINPTENGFKGFVSIGQSFWF